MVMRYLPNAGFKFPWCLSMAGKYPLLDDHKPVQPDALASKVWAEDAELYKTSKRIKAGEYIPLPR